MSQTVTTDEARRAAACRQFWSDLPLNLAYRREVADRPFTLREFVAFVVAMPLDQFSANTGEIQL